MVTRILSGYSIRGLLHYNEAKVESGKASLILASRFGLDIRQLSLRHKLNRFERLTLRNESARRNALHIMLNFDRSDSLTHTRLTAIASAYMEGIGFGAQPYLVYLHRDVSHPHLHIVTTNITADGSRIDFHNIGRTLSQSVRKALEREFDLTLADGRAREQGAEIKPSKLKPARYGAKPTKASIYNVVSAVMSSYAFTSLPEYNAVLGQFNVLADRGREDSAMFSRRGLVYSLLDEKGNRTGVPIKASALGGKPILDRVEKKYARNTEKRKAFREPLKQAIQEVFSRFEALSRATLLTELGKKEIALVFRKNEHGRIYGLTFIDHRNRCVFNGSDLGKAYGAKAMLDRLSDTDKSLGLDKTPAKTGQGNSAPAFQNPGTEQALSSSRGILETLLQKADFDPSPQAPRRRKKKKQKQSVQREITNQI